MADFEVAIVGGGPAGVATAAALLRARPKARVAIVDAARFPRHKPCGGGLTGRALLALEALGLALRVRHCLVEQAEVRYRGVRRTLALPRPAAITCRRELDEDLLAQARARGATVLEGVRVLDLGRTERGPLRLTSSQGVLTADLVVGADGSTGICRRVLVGPASRPPIRLVHAVGLAEPGPGAMVFDFGPIDAGLRGYAWWFDAPDGGNAGAMHVPHRALGDTVGEEPGGRRLAELAGSAFSIGARLHGWPAHAVDERVPLVDRGLILVGDAAGIDPLLGEGIAVALADGLLAGGLLARALDGAGPDLLTRFPGLRRRSPMGRSLAMRRAAASLLYGWPSLVLPAALDEDVVALVAEEISGTTLVAERKGRALLALGRAYAAFARRTIRRWPRSAWPAPESRARR